MAVKAVGLFSGGLDSIIAAKIIKQQGIKVELVSFTTPFFSSKNAKEMAKQIKMPLKVFDVTKEYLKILRHPRHGYGSGMNPCIDCKIFMLKKAKEYAKRIGANFIFTGEVIGERPMSQNIQALKLIEKEAGLKGKLLRPLSAKLLPITETEKRWIKREKLLDIQGRRRNKQTAFAKEFGIKNYPKPAGGCLLTQKEYACKIRDLLKNKERISLNDIKLLKIGRHFRLGKSKIIVGRDEKENKELLSLRSSSDYIFEVPDVGSPITILQGDKTNEAIRLAAGLTLHYSDSKEVKALVNYGKKNLSKALLASDIKSEEIKKLNITFFS